MKLFPAIYDAFMRPLEAGGIRRLRAAHLPAARGRVLDLGAGTGANTALYAPDAQVVLLDPDPAMLRQAVPRAGGRSIVAGDGQLLPFADRSFDAVIFTLVLCTIPRPEAAVREAVRVLRPGGCVVAVEHVRAPGRVLAAGQRALTPLWKHLAGGCHLDRDTGALLAGAGLVAVERQTAWRGILLGSTWKPAG